MNARRHSAIPRGCSTESKRPEALFGRAEGPAHFRSAAGAELVDARGRRVVDFAMALGPCVLGYNHPVVVEAVQRALADGVVATLSSPREVELAELLADTFPAIEQARFLKTGAEACAAAVRLARAYTGRTRVLGCGYFGWHDWCQTGGGVPAPVQALYRTFAFNDADGFRARLETLDEPPAAVILEPVVREAPDPAFLAAVREICDRRGIVLILDEVKTGVRLAPGGAQERFGIRPDLTVLGKAIAGGLPLAAVGGRREILAAWDRVWISSTLAGESLSLAAALAVLHFVREHPVCEHVRAVGGRLLEGFRRLVAAHPARLACFGLPEMNALVVKPDAPEAARLEPAFFLDLYARGYLLKRDGYNFVSYAHTAEQVDGCLAACGEAVARKAG